MRGSSTPKRRSSFAASSPTGRWSRRGWKARAAARAYLLDHRRERAFTVNIGEPGGGDRLFYDEAMGMNFRTGRAGLARDFRRDRRQ